MVSWVRGRLCMARVDSSPWIQVLNEMEIGVVGTSFQVRAKLVSHVEGVIPKLHRLAMMYE